MPDLELPRWCFLDLELFEEELASRVKFRIVDWSHYDWLRVGVQFEVLEEDVLLDDVRLDDDNCQGI